MSYPELCRWREFAALEPLPSERVDIAGAVVASTLANINRRSGAKPASLSDFMIVEKVMSRASELSKTEEEREADHLRATILALGGSIS